MSKKIYEVSPKDQSKTLADFPELWNQSEASKYFDMKGIEKPALQYQKEFLDHIAEFGLSNLYRTQNVMEAITSPSMPYSDVIQVVENFLARLNGASRVLIIDPYFYAKSTKVHIPVILKGLLSQFSSALDEIFIVTNGRKNEINSDIHAAILSVRPKVKIQDFVTDEFHDRFWIDPDKQIGVITGTSLNGLGKKIALVDKLRTSDVKDIVGLAMALGVPL
jgi:hypothetical protein